MNLELETQALAALVQGTRIAVYQHGLDEHDFVSPQCVDVAKVVVTALRQRNQVCEGTASLLRYWLDAYATEAYKTKGHLAISDKWLEALCSIHVDWPALSILVPELRERTALHRRRTAIADALQHAQNTDELDHRITQILSERAVASRDLLDWQSWFPEEHERFSEELEGERIACLPTGYASLDDSIGGYPLGYATVIGGRPGKGKSSFLLGSSIELGFRGFRGLYFTPEDTRRTIHRRLTSKASQLSLQGLSRFPRGLAPSNRSRALRASQELLERGASLHVEWNFDGRISAREICGLARVAHHKEPIRWVAVDYLHKLKDPIESRDDLHQLKIAMESFAELATDLEIAVIVGSQLNRDSSKENRAPRLSDMKGSGDIEQLAKLVIAPDWNRDGDKYTDVKFHVLKNNDGFSGEIVASFDPNTATWR